MNLVRSVSTCAAISSHLSLQVQHGRGEARGRPCEPRVEDGPSDVLAAQALHVLEERELGAARLALPCSRQKRPPRSSPWPSPLHYFARAEAPRDAARPSACPSLGDSRSPGTLLLFLIVVLVVALTSFALELGRLLDADDGEGLRRCRRAAWPWMAARRALQSQTTRRRRGCPPPSSRARRRFPRGARAKSGRRAGRALFPASRRGLPPPTHGCVVAGGSVSVPAGRVMSYNLAPRCAALLGMQALGPRQERAASFLRRQHRHAPRAGAAGAPLSIPARTGWTAVAAKWRLEGGGGGGGLDGPAAAVAVARPPGDAEVASSGRPVGGRRGRGRRGGSGNARAAGADGSKGPEAAGAGGRRRRRRGRVARADGRPEPSSGYGARAGGAGRRGAAGAKPGTAGAGGRRGAGAAPAPRAAAGRPARGRGARSRRGRGDRPRRRRRRQRPVEHAARPRRERDAQRAPRVVATPRRCRLSILATAVVRCQSAGSWFAAGSLPAGAVGTAAAALA